MPKLDIDWSKIGEEFKYASQDRDGSIWVWKEPPVLTDSHRWMPLRAGLGNPTDFYKLTCAHLNSCCAEYANTLTERPCKVKELTTNGHPHASLMAEYAKDAINNKEPWRLWEYKTPGVPSLWFQFHKHPEWREQVEYRRKIKTVTITLPESLAIEFVNLCHIANASKAVSVAIQEALNKEQE